MNVSVCDIMALPGGQAPETFGRIQISLVNRSSSMSDLGDRLADLQDEKRPFALQEICYHLAAARQRHRLEQILCSIPYLHDRCRLTDIYGLIKDFLLYTGDGLSRQRECSDYEAFLRRHAHRLNQFPDMLFSLSYHEGPPAAQNQARELFRHGQWKLPWLRMEEVPVSWGPKRAGETDLGIEIVNKVDFEHPSLSCIAPRASVAYAMIGLGRIGIVDLALGRLLSVVIPVRRCRILRLSCSPNGRFLVAAYEDGSGEVLAMDIDVAAERVASSRLTDFAHLLPQYEAPTMRCTENRLWYQDASGQIAWVLLGDEEVTQGTLGAPAIESGCELSCLEPWGSRLVMTLRKGAESLALVCQPGESTLVHSCGHRQVTALCPLNDDRIALAFSNGNTVIYLVSQVMEEMASFSTGEASLTLAAADDLLVGVTQMGAIWLADVAVSPAAPSITPMSKAFLAAHSLHLGADDSFVLAAGTSITTFRFDRRAARSVGQLLDVFPVTGIGGALLVHEREGAAWLVRLGQPDQVPLASEQEALWSVAYDRRNYRFLACDLSGPPLTVDVEQMKRGETLRLPAECRCTTDPQGGFWVFAPPTSLYYLHPSGPYAKVADVDLDIAGPVQLRCCDGPHPILSIEAPCRTWSDAGSDIYFTLCFYRVLPRFWRKRVLKKIGEWSIPAAEGRLETWVYLLPFKQFLLKVDDRFWLGSAKELRAGRWQFFRVPGMYEPCNRATAVPNSPKAFFLGAGGNLYLLDAARRRLDAVHSGTAMVTQMSADIGQAPLHVVCDGTHLRTCHFEKGER